MTTSTPILVHIKWCLIYNIQRSPFLLFSSLPHTPPAFPSHLSSPTHRLNLSFLTPLFLNHLHHPFLINPYSTTLLVAPNHLLTLKIMWLITPPYSCLWRPSRGPCSAHAIHYISMFFIHAYLLDINILFLISPFLWSLLPMSRTVKIPTGLPWCRPKSWS
jgi:hypothetical protein